MRQYRITLFSAAGQAVPYLMTGRARGLEALGHHTQTIDLDALARQSAAGGGQAAMRELVDSIRAFGPDAFFFCGVTALIQVATAPGRTAPLLSLFEKPMVSFYTCSDLERPGRLRELGRGYADRRFFVFVYDPFLLHLLERMGMRGRCAPLDLASDPELFRPTDRAAAAAALRELNADVPETGFEVSFAANRRDAGADLPVLGQDFEPSLRHTGLITAEKSGWHRTTWLAPMKDRQLAVFGNNWKSAGEETLGRSWQLLPFCRYTQLPLVYAASEINLNITAPEMADSYPTRVFDIMAGGGLVVSDLRDCARRLFSPGTDMIAATGPAEMRRAVDDLLKDKGRAQEIRHNARRTILERHSWQTRMRQALETLEKCGLLGSSGI